MTTTRPKRRCPTGKGNDQVRFELAIKRFAPDMPIIAPWREWDIKSRDEEIDYAEAHNVPLKISRETNYSKDKNLWHLSHEGLDLEDPANEPQYDKPGFLEMGVSPIAAPDAPTYVTLDFEKGVPVAIDGEKMKASDIIRKLNDQGGRSLHGRTRYNNLRQGLHQLGYQVDATQAMSLLRTVAQGPDGDQGSTGFTQWSEIFDLTRRSVTMNILREWNKTFTFGIE